MKKKEMPSDLSQYAKKANTLSAQNQTECAMFSITIITVI